MLAKTAFSANKTGIPANKIIFTPKFQLTEKGKGHRLTLL
jgi:hypothetical protein